MTDKNLEKSILEIAEQLTVASQKAQPSVFDKDFWTGRMLEFAMKDPAFKIEMFRFVDVFSVLKTPEQIGQHLREYFLRPGQEIPASMQLVIRGAASGIGQKLGGGAMAAQITDMAKKFIVGDNMQTATAALAALRTQRVGFTLDLLGEAALSEEESKVYLQRYTEAIDQIAEAAASWSPVPLLDHDALGDIPKVNVSIKVSSLYSAIDPLAFEESVRTLYDRLLPLLVRARSKNVFINLDLEQYSLKDLTFELFRRLRAAPELAGYAHLGVVVQAYLRDAYDDAEALVKLAKKTKQPFTIRLVKGAYWDYETIAAKQKGWPAPVFEKKSETDASYEQITQLLLQNFPHVRLAVGSHNLRSVAHAIAFAKKEKLPAGAYEVQMLYGMAEPIRQALVERGERVRVYAPVGDLLPGMAYLVRRLLENTSNEGFLRQRFVEAKTLGELLVAPEPAPKKKIAERVRDVSQPFENEPLRDFSRAEVREQFTRALEQVKKQLPLKVPLSVAGVERSQPNAKRENPARLNETIADLTFGTAEDAQRAVAAAAKAFPAWRDTPVEDRAAVLLRAAESMRDKRDSLSALMALEVGKTAREADADLCEAIDFCEYYAREALRLFAGQKLKAPPGEDNQMVYEARGVAAIIAPWNFPAAILTGMTTAALVAGNTVIMKPAEQSTAIAWRIFELLREALQKAGAPADVLHFLPGKGEEVGAVIAGAKDTALVCFTGSRDVGMQILKGATELQPGQDHLRKVILELGGKNAIIVDDDADLDEAVIGVMQSAFGFQGQKCSACSRAVVVGERYDEFCERLAEATRTLRHGPPDDLAATFGPVVDEEAYERLKHAVEDGHSRLKPLLSEKPSKEKGYFIPPQIFACTDAKDRLAQEELFGPFVVVMKAKDFSEALSIANGTSYALTGGIFSRSPLNLDRARKEFRVGNLYMNRGITGALVARQPFGGSKLSGIGSKAGGPDYLLQFTEPRVVTENTMRRGFAPDVSE